MEFQNYSKLEMELFTLSSKCSSVSSNENSKRHLNLGYLNRLFMIQRAREKIILIISNQKEKPLQHDEATDLKLFLNSFYINLRGALDNLAWFLNYELCLQENVIEDPQKGNSRRFTELFGNSFLEKLQSKNGAITKELNRYSSWYKELKDYRDPAAHRIPLAFLQSTISESDIGKFKEINKRWVEVNENFSNKVFFENLEESNKKLDEALSILNEYSRAGKFSPNIITSEGTSYAIRSAEKQIEDDYKNFLEISK